MIKITNNANITLTNPAVESQLIEIESVFGFKLPNEYKEFLLFTNGCTTDESVSIFGTNEILEMNSNYEVQEYAKGYVAIGNIGGDDFLLMKAEENAVKVIRVDCGVMDPIYSHPFVDDFIEWINNGAIDSEEEIEDENYLEDELGQLILIAPPKNGSSDLVIIEKAFNIQYRAFDILKGYKNVPFVLANNIKVSDASEKIKSLGELGKLLIVKKYDA